MATAEDFKKRDIVPRLESQESRLVGKCLFCPLGDADKRGVLCTSKIYRTDTSYSEVSYSCNLGKIGKGCSIPELYQLAYNGAQVGRSGDHTASLHNTPFA